MKKTNALQSPRLLVLLCLLLAVVLYVRLVFLPLNEKIVTVTSQNTTMASELELYNHNLTQEKSLEKYLQDLERDIDTIKEESFLQGDRIADDVAIMAAQIPVRALELMVGQPERAALPGEAEPLGYDKIPIQLSFKGTIEEAVAVLGYFENISQGAYVVEAVSGDHDLASTGIFQYDISLSLYVKSSFDGAL